MLMAVSDIKVYIYYFVLIIRQQLCSYKVVFLALPA